MTATLKQWLVKLPPSLQRHNMSDTINPTYLQLFEEIHELELPENIRERVLNVIDSAVAEPEDTNESDASFMDCYNILRDTVGTLKQMQEPDVDAIIPLVERGMKAYKGCEARIKQVEGFLSAFEDPSAE